MSFLVSHYLVFPDQIENKIRLLHFLLTLLLQKKTIYPLEMFRLIPVDTLSRAFFVQVNAKSGEYLYCEGIPGFSLILEPALSKTSTCPFAREHEVFSLYETLCQHLHYRHPPLSNLFSVISEEILSESRCTFCTSRKRLIQHLFEPFEKTYPYTTAECIEPFLRYPFSSKVDTSTLLSVHLHSLNALFSQLRNPQTRKDILAVISDTLHEMEDVVQQAVDKNDDTGLDRITQFFKIQLQQFLDERCPFVRTKTIDFKRWLLSLVLFIQLQSPVSTPSLRENYDQKMLKKTILLLHLFFHYDRSLTSQDRFFLLDEKGNAQSFSLDYQRLDRIHPLYRGEYIQEFIDI